MGTPGSGRYTTYVPVKNDKVQLLSRLFKGGMFSLYGNQEKNSDAAAKAAVLAKSLMDGKGDPDIFGSGVNMQYGESPDTTQVGWKAAGDPANPYVPDISSPGPGKTDPKQKDADPGITTADVKPAFDPKKPTDNTASPSAVAPTVGPSSIGSSLKFGKSSK